MNVLHEKKLYRNKRRVELSIYPFFSPEALVAEGTAEYGNEIVFPLDKKINFAKNVLLPLVGVDTTDVATYFKVTAILKKGNYLKNEVAQKMINGAMSEKQAIAYMGGGEPAKKQVEFIKKYRSYVVNYDYGKSILENYFQRKLGPNPTAIDRWNLFEKVLSDETRISDLLDK